MWSVWAETVDLYLCRGMAWVASVGNAPQVFKTPATVPLATLLARTAQGPMALGSTGARRRRFRVYLGSSLCPPIRFDIPEGAVWRDLPWLAQRQAALALDMKPADAAQLACALSPSATGLAAAMHVSVRETIEAWTDSQGSRCISIEPMWSHVTYLHRAALGSCDGLALREPDGRWVTLCIKDGLCTHALVDGAGQGREDEKVADQSGVLRLAWKDPSDMQGERTMSKASAWAPCFEREPA